MSKQDPWFIAERAFAFVSLALTKNHDVAVRPYVGRDISIDLLAEFFKNGNSTLRFFGAQLIGHLDLPPIERMDDRVNSHLGRDPFEAGLPLCAFVIGVRKPEGFYRWIVEPAVHEGQANLKTSSLTQREIQTQWRPFDDAGAERLVAEVNEYYDALHSARKTA